jgi:hypothetical protein
VRVRAKATRRERPKLSVTTCGPRVFVPEGARIIRGSEVPHAAEGASCVHSEGILTTRQSALMIGRGGCGPPRMFVRSTAAASDASRRGPWQRDVRQVLDGFLETDFQPLEMASDLRKDSPETAQFWFRPFIKPRHQHDSASTNRLAANQ